MIKKLSTMALFLIIVLPLNVYATTYYMANNPCSGNSGWGNGSNSNDGSKAYPFLTFEYATNQMSGGDTLIIDDGIYTGSSNAIFTYAGNEPPVGSADNYTIIKAENNGEVLFDGEGLNLMFYIQSAGEKYWQFEGIVVANPKSGGAVTLIYSSYVKFINVGAYDATAGNSSVFTAHGASYILYEGCYAFGSGRYRFLSYLSDHLVYRNCVGRPDQIDTTGSINPSAGFSIYSSNYVEVQNCIVIDGDQDSYWVTNARQGCFFVPTTAGASTYVAFRNNIGLNTHLGGFQTASAASNITVENMAIWDCPNDDESAARGLFMNFRGSSTTNTATNITYGGSDAPNVDGSWAPGWASLSNSIFYNLTFDSNINFFSWGVPAINDYNCYYENTNNTGRTGSSDLTTINPLHNSIKYITRIESESDLKGAGKSGVDIGANVVTLIGTPGTLYGEDGYDTETNVSMWPFPNEKMIKSKMAEYTDDTHGISGTRGFCANGKQLNGVDDITLTSYIWEYLGNQIPKGIYNKPDKVQNPRILQP